MSHRTTRVLAHGLMTLGPCLGVTNLWLIAENAQFVPWPVLPPTTAGGHFLLGFTAMSCMLGGRRLLRRTRRPSLEHDLATQRL